MLLLSEYYIVNANINNFENLNALIMWIKCCKTNHM